MTPARPRKRWSRYVAITLLVLLMPIFLLGTAIAATGTVTVQVDDRSADGISLYLPVPALLLDVAVFLAPRLIPQEELAEVRREVAPYRANLEVLAKEIRNMPNGVLVEVESPHEHVRVAKEGRNFAIQVHSEETNVSVAVPARLMSRALDIL